MGGRLITLLSHLTTAETGSFCLTTVIEPRMTCLSHAGHEVDNLILKPLLQRSVNAVVNGTVVKVNPLYPKGLFIG